MLKCSKHKLIFVLTCLGWLQSHGQEGCKHQLSGRLLTFKSEEPIPFGHIQTPDTAIVCDAFGEFSLEVDCSQPLVIQFNAIGYEAGTDTLYWPVQDPVTLHCVPSPGIHQLGPSVIVAGRRGNKHQRLYQHSISRQELAPALAKVQGVRMLAAGNVAKPVVQGVYGARVPIVDGSVELGSQNWGLDHAPELDGERAAYAEVIHGARSVWHSGIRGGSVVLIKPELPDSVGPLSGRVHQAYATNGRAVSGGLRISKGTRNFGWQLQGSYSNAGDQHTPDYYLRNTGLSTYASALDVRGKAGDRFWWEAGVSGYLSDRGVLRGSHIGNLTDLDRALTRDVPFYTEDAFARELTQPYQHVTHLTGRGTLGYTNGHAKTLFRVASQQDHRQEFDVRRGGLREVPALDLVLTTNDLRVEHIRKRLQVALHYRSAENRNTPGTQVRPLIPDYIEQTVRAAAVWRPLFGFENWTFGGQVSAGSLVAWPLSIGLNPRFVRHDRSRLQGRLAVDYAWDLSAVATQFSAVLESRAPTVQEWFSFGLHQGVSGLEEGDPDLRPESTAKGLFNSVIDLEGAQIQVHGFAQITSGFIQLAPTGEVRLTTRGAFPVFRYTQQDAALAGADIEVRYFPKWRVLNRLVAGVRTMRGSALDGTPLVLMAPVEAYGRVVVQTYKSYPGKDPRHTINYAHLQWSAELRRVGQQRHHPEDIDFGPATPGYWLLGAHLTYHPMRKDAPTKWRINVGVENALNVAYRNYLNRMRYFADEPGINATLKLQRRF